MNEFVLVRGLQGSVNWLRKSAVIELSSWNCAGHCDVAIHWTVDTDRTQIEVSYDVLKEVAVALGIDSSKFHTPKKEGRVH